MEGARGAVQDRGVLRRHGFRTGEADGWRVLVGRNTRAGGGHSRAQQQGGGEQCDGATMGLAPRENEKVIKIAEKPVKITEARLGCAEVPDLPEEGTLIGGVDGSAPSA